MLSREEKPLDCFCYHIPSQICIDHLIIRYLKIIIIIIFYGRRKKNKEDIKKNYKNNY